MPRQSTHRTRRLLAAFGIGRQYSPSRPPSPAHPHSSAVHLQRPIPAACGTLSESKDASSFPALPQAFERCPSPDPPLITVEDLFSEGSYTTALSEQSNSFANIVPAASATQAERQQPEQATNSHVPSYFSPLLPPRRSLPWESFINSLQNGTRKTEITPLVSPSPSPTPKSARQISKVVLPSSAQRVVRQKPEQAANSNVAPYISPILPPRRSLPWETLFKGGKNGIRETEIIPLMSPSSSPTHPPQVSNVAFDDIKLPAGLLPSSAQCADRKRAPPGTASNPIVVVDTEEEVTVSRTHSQALPITSDEELLLFADGSFQHNLGGAGIVVHHGGGKWSGRAIALGRVKDNNLAELHAIYDAFELAREVIRSHHRRVIIRSDSLSAIQWIAASRASTNAATELVHQVANEERYFNRLGIDVKLWWVRGHGASVGNQLADRLAKSGRERSIAGGHLCESMDFANIDSIDRLGRTTTKAERRDARWAERMAQRVDRATERRGRKVEVRRSARLAVLAAGFAETGQQQVIVVD